MSVLPHERGFRWRPPVFWILTAASLAQLARTPGLTPAQTAAGAGAGLVGAAALYVYARWLVRLDGAFEDVHPAKIRVTTLAAFYGSCLLALSVWLMGVLLAFTPAGAPLERAAPLVFVPGFLASAAGALKGGRESGVLD